MVLRSVLSHQSNIFKTLGFIIIKHILPCLVLNIELAYIDASSGLFEIKNGFLNDGA
jgi:hypothetical protein